MSETTREPSVIAEIRYDVVNNSNAHHDEQMWECFTIGHERAIVEYIDAIVAERDAALSVVASMKAAGALELREQRDEARAERDAAVREADAMRGTMYAAAQCAEETATLRARLAAWGDWCDVCNAPQWVVGDGSHWCATIATLQRDSADAIERLACFLFEDRNDGHAWSDTDHDREPYRTLARQILTRAAVAAETQGEKNA